MTQCEKILKFIEQNGSISSMDAFHLGITRISARIYDLKKKGVEITAKEIHGKNVDGKPIRYFRYMKAV